AAARPATATAKMMLRMIVPRSCKIMITREACKWLYALLRGRNAEDAAVGLVGEQVERAIRALPHVADAPAQFVQQALFLDRFAILQVQPRQQLEFQRAIEQ